MRHILAAVLAITCLFTLPGYCGTTYYVSPSGDDGNDGLSAGAPKTITWALNSVSGTNTVQLLPGTYPANQTNLEGTFSPNYGGRMAGPLVFVGSLSDPGSTVLEAPFNIWWQNSGGTKKNAYISVKGLRFKSMDINGAKDGLNPVHRDTIAYCIIDSSFTVGGGDSNYIGYNRIGNRAQTNKFSLCGSGYACFSNVVEYNVFNLGVGAVGANNAMQLCGQDGLRWDHNVTFSTVWNTGTPTSHTNTWYRVRNSTISNSSWNLLQNFPTTDGMYILNVRDSCYNNLCVTDTFLTDPASVGRAKAEFSTSGNELDATRNNTWSHCIFRVNGALCYQASSNGDVHEFNQFLTKYVPFAFPSGQDTMQNIVIRHCTFVSEDPTVIEAGYDSTSAFRGINNRIVSNIFACISSANGTHVRLRWWLGAGVRDSNLVYAFANDSHNAYDYTYPPQDGASAWGNPGFYSASWSDPNLRPDSTKAAVGPTWADGYVGAIAPGTVPAALYIFNDYDLDIGYANTPYATQLTTRNAAPPIASWAISAGTLPSGVALSPTTGAITGVPGAQGDYTFTVHIVDDLGATADKELKITVMPESMAPGKVRGFWRGFWKILGF